MAINNRITLLKPAEIQKIMGGVMLLTQHSPLHKSYCVSAWYQQIYPSIVLNQFRYYEDEHETPVAFCNWAFLSEVNMNEIISGERNIGRKDWISGCNIFIPEMIAPFGHAKMVVNDLRRNIFVARKGGRVCAIRCKIDHCGSFNKPKVHWVKI